ncbi:hypothetical protein E2562_018057 [Oryza meyeriana var. granulata]|uniref:Uncharacterized protein n=1 Tax=Oryza meyeriana var. granulata TaxID=110450 RepID=A0A6G1CR74_9ORYZ|nr:hypothetical protein E2562_018057 [Oryza meyeriana var. granulata]
MGTWGERERCWQMSRCLSHRACTRNLSRHQAQGRKERFKLMGGLLGTEGPVQNIQRARIDHQPEPGEHSGEDVDCDCAAADDHWARRELHGAAANGQGGGENVDDNDRRERRELEGDAADDIGQGARGGAPRIDLGDLGGSGIGGEDRRADPVGVEDSRGKMPGKARIDHQPEPGEHSGEDVDCDCAAADDHWARRELHGAAANGQGGGENVDDNDRRERRELEGDAADDIGQGARGGAPRIDLGDLGGSGIGGEDRRADPVGVEDSRGKMPGKVGRTDTDASRTTSSGGSGIGGEDRRADPVGVEDSRGKMPGKVGRTDTDASRTTSSGTG